MMKSLVKMHFERLIKFGQLTVFLQDGSKFVFGPGGEPSVTVRFKKNSILLRACLAPSVAIGEAYMDGSMTIEEGTLYDFLDMCTRDTSAFRSSVSRHIPWWFTSPALWLGRFNTLVRSKNNVAHHYDLSSELYELFLDEDRQYSCAYFPTGKETLDEAQRKKKRHLTAKMLLKPGQHVLDIGSGWGGLSIHMAKSANVDVTGITLSEEQLAYANEKVHKHNLSDRVRFALRDYRNETGSYDRIISVGMFEHVGVSYYDKFFDKLSKLLKPDGVAVLHSIGRNDMPGGSDPWINKYIFPGGYVPSLSEVFRSLEKVGMWVCDTEIWRIHYADTLRKWRERFLANRAKAVTLYDERFCRMWEFYLASCEVGFRNLNLMVFQMQISHKRDAVPLSRDYITDFDRL